ncbi:unnamed protein product, partial [Nesidiocoris tenuis]
APPPPSSAFGCRRRWWSSCAERETRLRARPRLPMRNISISSVASWPTSARCYSLRVHICR